MRIYAFSHLCKRLCPSVRPSVRRSLSHTRVEFLRNGLYSNQMASGTWNYAILKTIRRQARGRIARTHLMTELCQTCYPLCVSSCFLPVNVFSSCTLAFFLPAPISSPFSSSWQRKCIEYLVHHKISYITTFSLASTFYALNLFLNSRVTFFPWIFFPAFCQIFFSLGHPYPSAKIAIWEEFHPWRFCLF